MSTSFHKCICSNSTKKWKIPPQRGQIIVSRPQAFCQLPFRCSTVFKMRGNYPTDSSLSFKNYLESFQSSFDLIWPDTAAAVAHGEGQSSKQLAASLHKGSYGAGIIFPWHECPRLLFKFPLEGKLQFQICSSPPELTDLQNRCHWVSTRNKPVWATSLASGTHANAWKLTSCLKAFSFSCFSSQSRHGRDSSPASDTQHF